MTSRAEPEGARRLAEVFVQAERCQRAALVGYLVAGDPDLDTTHQVIAAAAGKGLDLVELGIPYGDPLADGPTIAAAAQRALRAGTSVEDCLRLVEALPETPPVVLFTYYNPIYQYGLARFAARATAVGVAGLIVPDITLESLTELRAALAGGALALTLLVSPTTPLPRAAAIAAASEGFVYVVSRLGVTGAGRGPDLDWLRDRLSALRRVTGKPLAVGFGLSSPDQVAAVAPLADGVIIGSGLVRSYDGRRGAAAAVAAAAYVAALAERRGRAPALSPGAPR